MLVWNAQGIRERSPEEGSNGGSVAPLTAAAVADACILKREERQSANDDEGCLGKKNVLKSQMHLRSCGRRYNSVVLGGLPLGLVVCICLGSAHLLACMQKCMHVVYVCTAALLRKCWQEQTASCFSLFTLNCLKSSIIRAPEGCAHQAVAEVP